MLVGGGSLLVAGACWQVMKWCFAGLADQAERTARSKWLGFLRTTALVATGTLLVAALVVVLEMLILLIGGTH